MAERKVPGRRRPVANVKQEVLEAYTEAAEQAQERIEADLRPAEKIEEKAAQQAVQLADSLSTEGILKGIGSLKSEIGKMLSQLSDRLEEEVDKYQSVQKAAAVKQKELQEIYEIQKSASTLAALIEAEHQKRYDFEAEMAARREELNREMQALRAESEKEKKLHEAEIKERDAGEAKRREREKEEYQYGFTRQQHLAKDKSEDEKARLERDMQSRKEQMERDLAEREKVVAQKEEELNELRRRVAAFPKEQETAIGKAVKEATERALLEAKNKEELLKKEFAGERNVLTTRVTSLEQIGKDQGEQILKLTQQAEKSYQQVQDIAVKAIEGSSNFKSFTSLQQWLAEQTRKPAADK